MNSIDQNTQARLNLMSSEELIIKIKDRLLQNGSSYYDIYKKYECQDKKGGINIFQIRKVIIVFYKSISVFKLVYKYYLIIFCIGF